MKHKMEKAHKYYDSINVYIDDEIKPTYNYGITSLVIKIRYGSISRGWDDFYSTYSFIHNGRKIVVEYGNLDELKITIDGVEYEKTEGVRQEEFITETIIGLEHEVFSDFVENKLLTGIYYDLIYNLSYELLDGKILIINTIIYPNEYGIKRLRYTTISMDDFYNYWYDNDKIKIVEWDDIVHLLSVSDLEEIKEYQIEIEREFLDY